MATNAPWVLAVERAYVEAATTAALPALAMDDAARRQRARAAAGAVASRFLAVGTPRSMGLVVDPAHVDEAALSIEAHGCWFAPTDLRAAGAAVPGCRDTSLAEALACDIVCIHVPIALSPAQLRRGTHVNVLCPMELGGELAQIAMIVRETPDLAQMAAGFVDGRQLDEITVFVLDGAVIPYAAVA